MTSNYKNSMYPRSFLCEEAKIKERTPLKKELCEIGEEAIWESRSTSFLFEISSFTNNFRLRASDEINLFIIQIRNFFRTKQLIGLKFGHNILS